MAKRKTLNIEQRSAICGLRNKDYTKRQITEKLKLSSKNVKSTFDFYLETKIAKGMVDPKQLQVPTIITLMCLQNEIENPADKT